MHIFKILYVRDKLMIKWRKYLKRCPFRDKISVEKAEQSALRRPSGDGIWIEKYCVPNGTPWRICASIFYRYYIPKGMTVLIKRHFIDNLTLEITPKELYVDNLE